MELRQLRYFIAVAEERNFSRAALRLHVSQPPLSMQIMALESELGVQLLERSNRGVSLTAAGEVFYEEACAVLSRLENGKRRAQRASQGEAGTLAIGFVSIADYGILPPTLKTFRTRFPLIEVELHELTTDAQIRDLRASRLDAGIALGPVSEAGLGFRTVLREALVLAAPSAHRLPARGLVDLRLLANENFIVTPRTIAPGLHDLVVRQCHDSGFVPRISQQARQMQTVISLVAAGMGIALVPASMQNLRRKGVQYRRLRHPQKNLLDIGVLTRSEPARPVLRHFLQTLTETAELLRRSPEHEGR